MARVIGSFDDLADSVQQAARLKAKERTESAQDRADQITREARQKAEQIEKETLEEANRRADEKRRARLTDAAREAKRRRLMAREEILDRVWNQGEEELRELVGSDEYAQTLRELACLAVQTLGSGHLVLAADPAGHDLLTEDRLSAWSEEVSKELDTSAQFEQASEPLDAWGGLVARTKDGREQMDARFSSRLETARRVLRDEVFRQLMDEG